MAPFALNAAPSVAVPPSSQRVVGLPQPLPRGTTDEVLNILFKQSLAALIKGNLKEPYHTVLYVHGSTNGALAALKAIGRVIPLRHEPGVAIDDQIAAAIATSAGGDSTDPGAVMSSIRAVVLELSIGDLERVVSDFAGQMLAEASLFCAEALLVAVDSSGYGHASVQKALEGFPYTSLLSPCYSTAVALAPQGTAPEAPSRQRSARLPSATSPSSAAGSQGVFLASLRPISVGDACSADVDLSLLVARARNEGSEAARELSTGFHMSLQLQAEKIQQLLSDLEWVGRTVIEQEAEIQRLRQQHDISQQAIHEANQELAALRPWRDMGHARLGPTFELANHQIDVFRSYVKALESPGHRAVGYLGRRLGRGRLGGGLRRMMSVAIALRKA